MLHENLLLHLIQLITKSRIEENNPNNPIVQPIKLKRLKCRSEIIIVITPADTGGLIINKTGVKNIDRRYGGKNRNKLIIERLLDFNKVTMRLIDPNKLLNPTMCKGKDMRSIDE